MGQRIGVLQPDHMRHVNAEAPQVTNVGSFKPLIGSLQGTSTPIQQLRIDTIFQRALERSGDRL
ncbi:hypothetical protein ASF43_20795 [Pseudorhodoferax sp. Leaf267]|nr:hypothetical protein ASF43_20795 [Pseudorhodoferax sp. Leaf267]